MIGAPWPSRPPRISDEAYIEPEQAATREPHVRRLLEDFEPRPPYTPQTSAGLGENLPGGIGDCPSRPGRVRHRPQARALIRGHRGMRTPNNIAGQVVGIARQLACHVLCRPRSGNLTSATYALVKSLQKPFRA